TPLLVANTRPAPRTAGALALPAARNSRWTIPSSVWRKGMGLRHGSVGGWFARCDAVQRGALLHRSDGQGAVGDAARGQLVQGSLEGDPARGGVARSECAGTSPEPACPPAQYGRRPSSG